MATVANSWQATRHGLPSLGTGARVSSHGLACAGAALPLMLTFAVLNVDAMVRSSLTHGGLFPKAIDSFLLSTQELFTRVSTLARYPEYSI
jgi:hypothetical protein